MSDSQERSNEKILVVDDQIGIVSFLYDFFTHAGLEVLQATSGKKALDIVKKEKPVVILLDIKLGWGRNGIEVLREIKQIHPSAKVIMMTSVDDEDVIEEAFNLGAADYIIKPFSLSYLKNVVALKMLNLEIKRIGDVRGEEFPKKGGDHEEGV
jgi:DNA-binding response OmpR family regulator